jgi:hypothetical protein
MEALYRYAISQHDLPDSDLPIKVLAYDKAAKKVHPVAAPLPKDFRIVRRCPEDPLLSLPEHPPQVHTGRAPHARPLRHS